MTVTEFDVTKAKVVELANDLYDTISVLYKNANNPDYNDLVTTETYLNIILHMTEELEKGE